MRTKYKYNHGQFVQTKPNKETGEVAQTGVIDAVVLRADGAYYAVEGVETEVAESDIAAVFRPVTPRAPKKDSEKKSKKAKAA